MKRPTESSRGSSDTGGIGEGCKVGGIDTGRGTGVRAGVVGSGEIASLFRSVSPWELIMIVTLAEAVGSFSRVIGACKGKQDSV